MSEVSQKIYDKAMADRGGTFNAITGEDVVKEDGYFVAMEDNGKVIWSVDADDIEDYINMNSLPLRNDHEVYLGIWIPGLFWHLDCSMWFKTENMARQFGKLNHQQAIWDCTNKKDIYL